MHYALQHGHLLIPLASERVITIGRGPRNGIRLNDGAVSRRHAAVTVVRGQVFIEDLQSQTGVVVNGTQIATKQQLYPGDHVLVGASELVLELDREAQSASGAAAVSAATDIGLGFAASRDIVHAMLAAGRLDDAAAMLAGTVAGMLAFAEQGRQVDHGELESMAACALQLARAAREERWVEGVFSVYAALAAPVRAVVVADLRTTMRALAPVSAPSFYRYLHMARRLRPQPASARDLEALVCWVA